MISGIGSGMSGMPSMDAMRQMQQKMFNKADGNGSGGLDATEFDAMVKNSPMAGQGPKGTSTEDMFKKIDGDSDGELSQAELEDAQRQMLSSFQSTMQAFGAGDSQDDSRSKSARGGAGTNDLAAQLRSLIDKVSSTYGGAGFDPARSLTATA